MVAASRAAAANVKTLRCAVISNLPWAQAMMAKTNQQTRRPCRRSLEIGDVVVAGHATMVGTRGPAQRSIAPWAAKSAGMVDVPKRPTGAPAGFLGRTGSARA